MKLKIVYALIIVIAAAAFVLQAEWLFYVAFAALLLTALAGSRSAAKRPLPAGMTAPHQIQAHGMRQIQQAPSLPKKKKKIRRPIIIVQPPAHAEGLTHGILEESVKRSLPHFMTPQEKHRQAQERAEKAELISLLREQRAELKDLRKELEHVPGYRRRSRDEDED
ncbi:MAG: hypothetical protein V1817_02160 [Candidatus Micrarchaeota archaeon]